MILKDPRAHIGLSVKGASLASGLVEDILPNQSFEDIMPKEQMQLDEE